MEIIADPMAHVTRRVAVRILLPPASATAGSPAGFLEAARAVIAERHRAAFEDLGATDVRIISETPDGRSFGARLRDLATAAAADGRGRRVGLVVLGGGSMPLARREDREAFLRTALARSTRALATSYYSADAVAVPDARLFANLPDLPADNALPRWLAERAGVPVADLRDRPRLAIDVDSPLDVLLLTRSRGCPPELRAIADEIAAVNEKVVAAIGAVARTLNDRRAQLLVAGRTSARTVAWLERNAACRVRVLIEERGLKASTALALGDADDDSEPTARPPMDRPEPTATPGPPRSLLGMLLDDRGPDAFGDVLTELADAAVVDTRVLLAHRLGADESGWPRLGDRLASDLLRPDEIADPWLRALTASAARARIPILLGGHTLVGPGLPLLGGA